VTELVHREKAHVLPLDSIRGIAATSVVIHHLLLMPTFLAAFPHNAWINCSFFRSSWLLVDLFFVLSGIVMSLSYVESDFGRFSLREFMVRRLARVYPLHIVMLIAILLFRLLRIGLVMAGVVVAAPAAFEVNNAYSFVLNVFLLHAMGFIDYLSWNAPSWSISVEFYTYLVFGLIVLLAQRMRSLTLFYVLCGLFAVGSLAFITFALNARSLEIPTDLGILRCFVGFFLGVMTVKIVRSLPNQAGAPAQGLLQLVAAIAAVGIVSLGEAMPGITFFAPLAFAVLLGSLLAFPDTLPLPRVLTVGPLVWLGRRSYSIYMVHALVVLFAEYFVRALGPRPIAALDSIWAGLPATLNLVVWLAAVLAVSNVTYRYVEIPGGKLLRNVLGSRSDFTPSPAPSAQLTN
jgi:peptidoglycan/LPS O-acetylase OafA/YrhL